MPSILRPLSAGVLAGLAVLGAAGAVGAQPAPPSPASPPTTTPPVTTPPVSGNPGANTWSVSPTGKDPANPSERPNFTYELTPGATLQDKVTVWNYSDSVRSFDVYARDAFNTSNGGIDLLRRDQESKDAGGWVKFSQERVTVPGKAGAVVPISIAVPADASPGDHDAGIVASLATEDVVGTGERQVKVEHRVGLRLYVRVAGPATPALVIDDVDSTYQAGAAPVGKGRVSVTYTVHNTGNIRLAAHQALTVKGPFGWSLAERTPSNVTELLPGSSRQYTETFDDISPAGRVTAEVMLAPVPPPAIKSAMPAIDPTVRSATAWAVPWALLVLLVLLVVARMVYRRFRSSRARTSPPTAAPPADEGVTNGASRGTDADSLALSGASGEPG